VGEKSKPDPDEETSEATKAAAARAAVNAARDAEEELITEAVRSAEPSEGAKVVAARAAVNATRDAEEELIAAVVRATDTDAAKKAAAAEALRSASDDLKKEIATEAVQTLSAEAKRDVASVLGVAASDSINRLAEAEPGDILKVAASQIALLASYYKAVLDQAKMSFRWALVAAGIGLMFFLGAVFFLLTRESEAIATVGVISGALVEVIAGINFYL